MIEIPPLGGSHKNHSHPRGIQTFTVPFYDRHLYWPSEIAIHKYGRFFHFSFLDFLGISNSTYKVLFVRRRNEYFFWKTQKRFYFSWICIQNVSHFVFFNGFVKSQKNFMFPIQNIENLKKSQYFSFPFSNWPFRGPPPPKNQNHKNSPAFQIRRTFICYSICDCDSFSAFAESVHLCE